MKPEAVKWLLIAISIILAVLGIVLVAVAGITQPDDNKLLIAAMLCINAGNLINLLRMSLKK